MRSLCATTNGGSCSPQLEEAHTQQRRPRAAKSKLIKKRRRTLLCTFAGPVLTKCLPAAEILTKSVSQVTQSCPALCNPMDGSPPGSSVHGRLQARILEWVAIPFSRDLPKPGIKPGSPVLQADSLPSEPPGKPQEVLTQHCTQSVLYQCHLICVLVPRLHNYPVSYILS